MDLLSHSALRTRYCEWERLAAHSPITPGIASRMDSLALLAQTYHSDNLHTNCTPPFPKSAQFGFDAGRRRRWPQRRRCFHLVVAWGALDGPGAGNQGGRAGARGSRGTGGRVCRPRGPPKAKASVSVAVGRNIGGSGASDCYGVGIIGARYKQDDFSHRLADASSGYRASPRR